MINKWHVKVLFCMPFIISEHTCSYEKDRTETIGRDAIDRVFVPLHAALHHGMGLCLKHRLLGVSFWGKLRGLLVRKMKEGKH